MKISNGLKKIVFNKLYEDLSHVEIIPYKDFIYFIDRENKYWYFEYNKNGILYWRYQFFTNFFELFSFEQSDFEPILSEWVEEVLNCKVVTTSAASNSGVFVVEEVLNCKVVTTSKLSLTQIAMVEEVLNCKVVTTSSNIIVRSHRVEEVLNCKVSTTRFHITGLETQVEEVLNCKIDTTIGSIFNYDKVVEEVLDNTI